MKSHLTYPIYSGNCGVPSGAPHAIAFRRKRVMTEQIPAAATDEQQEQQRGFSRYQSFLIALLAFAQFTIILDFIIMSPLAPS